MRHARAARVLAGVTTVAAALAAAGCNSREVSGGSGDKATVEERPYVNAQGTQQKQRSGVLKKVTAEWVVIQEGPNEIWIPRDMVLEIRMEKK